MGGSIYPRVDIELTDSTDRVYQAAKLYRAGKAKTVIVAAGNQPWNEGRVPEAQLIRDLLVEWGVSRPSIVLDTASKNTHENAINAAVALRENGCQSSLLVTSAWHMPRAIAAFKKLGWKCFRSLWMWGLFRATVIHSLHLFRRRRLWPLPVRPSRNGWVYGFTDGKVGTELID